MRHFSCIILAMSLLLVPAPHARAQAQDMGAVVADKPLLIIRFNQRTVYYTKALYTAVSRAVETKSEAMFSLTTIIPQTGNESHNAQYQRLAEQHTRQVLQEMQSIGVPPSRVKLSREFSSVLDYDEVHLRAF